MPQLLHRRVLPVWEGWGFPEPLSVDADGEAAMRFQTALVQEDGSDDKIETTSGAAAAAGMSEPEDDDSTSSSMSFHEGTVLGTAPLAGDSSSSSSISTSQVRPFALMELPLEIRLLIYRWLHRMGPSVPAYLTPASVLGPAHRPYVVRRVTLSSSSSRTKAHSRSSESAAEAEHEVDTNFEEEERTDDSGQGVGNKTNCNEPANTNSEDEDRVEDYSTATLLSPHRPVGGMPTALLQVSRAVYLEAREVALRHAELSFPSRFASGMWAARALLVAPRGSRCGTRGALTSWQRAAHRFARVEVLARDLSGAYAAEWEGLCGAWSEGLIGLRLVMRAANAAGPGVFVVDGRPLGREAPPPSVFGAGEDGSAPKPWVARGLALLRGLRRLEVELRVPGWDDTKKIQFCRDLGRALNGGGAECGTGSDLGAERVRVTCVEKVVDPEEEKASLDPWESAIAALPW